MIIENAGKLAGRDVSWGRCQKEMAGNQVSNDDWILDFSISQCSME